MLAAFAEATTGQEKLADAQLYALADVPLDDTRAQFAGDAATLSLQEIPTQFHAQIKRIYTFLQNLYDYLAQHLGDLERQRSELPAFLQHRKADDVLDDVRHLGAALKQEEASPNLRKALHDIRGGSMTALAMHIEMAELGDIEGNDCERMYILSRDHLKIMRNVVYDLDPKGHERDLAPVAHDIELLIEKWSNIDYRLAKNAIKIRLDCRFDGRISENCMEFSALDRVIYNLVNNATRFTTDQQVHLAILPVAGKQHPQVRFVVYNRISTEHQQTLLDKFGSDNLSTLYEGGFTTGGHGVGMRICADFVMHGYGLASVQDALQGGYLGIKLIDDYFVAWFHWGGHAE